MKKYVLAVAALCASIVLARDHIGFVNVGGAIEETLFANTVTNEIDTVIQIYSSIEKEAKIDVAKLISEASLGYPKGERKIAVYFVDDPSYPPQITVPGFFAVINVRGLKKDADSKKYATRIKKMALKGLALSCGFGANQDIGRCVMAAGSFETLKGIDSTSASYSPFCYFPLFDYLQARKLLNDTPPPDEE